MNKKILLLITTLTVSITLLGCDQNGQHNTQHQDFIQKRSRISFYLDPDELRTRFVKETLEPWLAAGNTRTGIVPGKLSRNWVPDLERPTSLTDQSRFIFVMSRGYQVTGRAEYLNSMKKATNALLEHFSAEVSGEWYKSVAADGRPINKSRHPYGYAFVILALANAYEQSGDTSYRDAAFSTWLNWEELAQIADYNKTGIDGYKSQNPLMHLFEAILVLHHATDSGLVLQSAKTLAEFTFSSLFQKDGGYLPEWYDGSWKPLNEEKNGNVDLGHQIEWAFLLSEAVQAGLAQEYLSIGNQLLDFALKAGYDENNGGLRSTGYYNGTGSGDKGWWQQAELLRTLMRYASDHDRKALWSKFETSLEYVSQNFSDKQNGGWYPTPFDPASSTKAPQPGVGYHITGMHSEALRLLSPDNQSFR